jgi:hypothetical protein
MEGGPERKRAKRGSSYHSDWKTSGMSASKRGSNYAHCDCCGTDINVGHGGIHDIKKHLATAKHQEMVKVSSSNQSLISLFKQSPIEKSVTRAEVLFANFIAEHNLPFLLADHFTHLTRAMFPDSQIAKAFRSAHTKTTCIVTGALNPYFAEPVFTQCQENPFSILCDEGTDHDDKNFAILVRLWDNQLGKPASRFLDMPICNIGTAEKLFEALDKALNERKIPWSNVIGFESDTTNVMVGKHNSILSRIKQKQPDVFSQGCVCHLSNLCLLAGVKALPIDVDDFFVDLFYYFDKSSKRKEELREFQEFTGTKELKIIKHCKTRWLSLEKAVKRVLQQWCALHAYFDREAESNRVARVLRLDEHLKSPLTKLVMLFLEFALDSLNKFNGVFQTTLPMLPSLKSEVKRILRIFLGRVIKADVIKAVGDDFEEIDLDDTTLELPDEELGIGHKTWGFLSDEEDELDDTVKGLFFSGVRDFYKAVTSTIIKKFTFDDNVVDDVAFLLPNYQDKVTTASIVRLAQRFSAAVPPEVHDALEEETLDYMLFPSSGLPCVTCEEGNKIKSEEVCAYWQQIGRMTTPDGIARFPNLSRLAKTILALPVSNAETERVFSIVRKIVTDYRTQMDQSTLCALVSCKLNSDSKCYDLVTPDELLKQARTATMEYNRAHSSKFNN